MELIETYFQASVVTYHYSVTLGGSTKNFISFLHDLVRLRHSVGNLSCRELVKSALLGQMTFAFDLSNTVERSQIL